MRELRHSLWVSFLISWAMEGKESSFLPIKKENVGESQQILRGFFAAQGSPETIPERYCVCLEDSVMDSDHPPFVGSPRWCPYFLAHQFWFVGLYCTVTLASISHS